MMDCGPTILMFLAFIQATCGQSVTLTGPPAIEQGTDTVYTCTRVGGASSYTFVWEDLSVGGLNIFIGGGSVTDPLAFPKYVNFGVSENGGTSTMTITNTQIEDEGQYRCSEGSERADSAELTVEVKSARNLSVESTIESNIDMYVATCKALDGRPDETITWMIGDDALSCDTLDEMSPTAGPNLSSTTSDCTFQATSKNYNQILKCVITGHQLDDLNGEETTVLDMHSTPGAGIITVGIQILENSTVRVSCDIDDTNQTDPRIRNYYIYSDSTLIHQSSTGVNFVDVPESDYDTNIEYNCVAGNYLGNATTFAPISTTTLTPTTTAAPEGTSPVVDSGPTDTGPAGLSAGAYAGIAIGVIACIVIIVVIVLYLLKPECCPCFGGSGPKSTGSSKPARSAVGSSNGSEKEKTRPQAAPRGHGSIQHTNDNPNQDMYAMVDKKKPGGDAPDRGSGPGQNEPQGMLYADLDLSHQAGHTEKHVPKNENDVVVYSSILV